MALNNINIVWIPSAESYEMECVLDYLEWETNIKWAKGDDISDFIPEDDMLIIKGWKLYQSCSYDDDLGCIHYTELPGIEYYMDEEDDGCNNCPDGESLFQWDDIRYTMPTMVASEQYGEEFSKKVREEILETFGAKYDLAEDNINNNNKKMKTRLEQARIDKFLGNDKNIDAVINTTDTSGEIVSRLAEIANAIADMATTVNNTSAMLEDAVEQGNVSAIEKYSATLKAMNKQFGPKGKAVSLFDVEKVLKIKAKEVVDAEEEAINALGL